MGASANGLDRNMWGAKYQQMMYDIQIQIYKYRSTSFMKKTEATHNWGLLRMGWSQVVDRILL